MIVFPSVFLVAQVNHLLGAHGLNLGHNLAKRPQNMVILAFFSEKVCFLGFYFSEKVYFCTMKISEKVYFSDCIL